MKVEITVVSTQTIMLSLHDDKADICCTTFLSDKEAETLKDKIIAALYEQDQVRDAQTEKQWKQYVPEGA